MCLTEDSWLARVSAAIEQLAAEAASLADGNPDQAAGRLAAIWEIVADADPGLARRLRGYTRED